MDRISQILVKYFTLGINDEEARILEEWRQKAEQNEALFKKMESREFLENALDSEHKRVCLEEWEKLERKTLYVRRQRRLLRVCQWAAAIVLPLTFAWVYMNLDRVDQKKGLEELLSEQSYRSKAVICLAEGERIVIYQDTTFQMNLGNGHMENRRDTISFLSADARDTTYSKSRHRIEVPLGGEYVARLEDGTIVHLDAASTLIVPQKFTSEIREVELIGHAYFSVSKDQTRPFVVKSGDVHVRVLGTEFDFKAYQGEDISATLVEGAVEVYNSRSTHRLSPNQQARIEEDGMIKVTNVDVYPFIAWKEERIVFRNESLESIMRVLERWYDVDCIFLSDEMKRETFTVDIEKYTDIGNVLLSIEKTDKIHFEVKGKQILIRKK